MLKTLDFQYVKGQIWSAVMCKFRIEDLGTSYKLMKVSYILWLYKLMKVSYILWLYKLMKVSYILWLYKLMKVSYTLWLYKLMKVSYILWLYKLMKVSYILWLTVKVSLTSTPVVNECGNFLIEVQPLKCK